MIKLSEYIRSIAIYAQDRFHIKEIKIFFSAPDPRQAGSETLEVGEVENEANFQWVSFQALFSTEKSNYYVYSIPLQTNGVGKPPDIVFESDDDWSGAKKNIPSDKVRSGDIKRVYPRIFKKPNLFPAKALPFGVPTNYINTHNSDRGSSYSSEEFKRFFDNDFYIVLDPKSKKLENPFGRHVEPVGKTYPKKKELPEKTAKEDSPMSGGRDIMKRLVEKLRTVKKKPSKKEYFTNGWGIVRKWQQKQRSGPSDGFDIMQQIYRHPLPVKKSLTDPSKKAGD